MRTVAEHLIRWNLPEPEETRLGVSLCALTGQRIWLIRNPTVESTQESQSARQTGVKTIVWLLLEMGSCLPAASDPVGSENPLEELTRPSLTLLT